MTSAKFNFDNCLTEPYQLYDEMNVNNLNINIPLYDTKISKLFFKSNINYLQQQIIFKIFDKTHVEISTQSAIIYNCNEINIFTI